MLKIRLQRVGRKNDPSFRLVVLEGTEGPKSGKHVDHIGFYNAVTKQKTLDADKAKHWVAKGAQPSDTVYNMLVTAGVIEGKKRNVLPKKSPIVKEPEPAPETAPAPEAAAPVVAEEVATTEESPVETPIEAPAESPVEESPAEVPAEEPAALAEETPAA